MREPGQEGPRRIAAGTRNRTTARQNAEQARGEAQSGAVGYGDLVQAATGNPPQGSAPSGTPIGQHRRRRAAALFKSPDPVTQSGYE